MKFLICLLLVWGAAGPVAAIDYVIIVNAKSTIVVLSRDEVINIFMGRTRRLASGINAVPVDLALPATSKDQFYTRLVGKSAQDINSYWARLMFTGQGFPPRQAESESEVLEMVGSLRGGIGYIDRNHVTKQVKVVFELAR